MCITFKSSEYYSLSFEYFLMQQNVAERRHFAVQLIENQIFLVYMQCPSHSTFMPSSDLDSVVHLHILSPALQNLTLGIFG